MTDRSVANRIGGLTRHGRHGSATLARQGRDGLFARLLLEADPASELPEDERHRRAQALRQAHMVRLARRSAAVRAARVRARAGRPAQGAAP